jgi:ATP-dependent Clp protease ATP-binding subunit ClpA
MPKVNVYLPDDLADDVKELEVPLSATCQAALRREVDLAWLRRVPVGRFTPRLQKLLERAAAMATSEGKSYVGAEHVQLAIIDEGNSVPAGVIDGLGQTEAIRAGIHNAVTGAQASNRAGDGKAVYGWLVHRPDGTGVQVIRLDGSQVLTEKDQDGNTVFTDPDRNPLDPIPVDEAPYIVDRDEDGNPVVIVDAQGRHTGAKGS